MGPNFDDLNFEFELPDLPNVASKPSQMHGPLIIGVRAMPDVDPSVGIFMIACSLAKLGLRPLVCSLILSVTSIISGWLYLEGLALLILWMGTLHLWGISWKWNGKVTTGLVVVITLLGMQYSQQTEWCIVFLFFTSLGMVYKYRKIGFTLYIGLVITGLLTVSFYTAGELSLGWSGLLILYALVVLLFHIYMQCSINP